MVGDHVYLICVSITPYTGSRLRYCVVMQMNNAVLVTQAFMI